MIVWTHYPEGDERRPGAPLFVGGEVPRVDKWRGKRLAFAWLLAMACSIGFWIGFAYSILQIDSFIAKVTR